MNAKIFVPSFSRDKTLDQVRALRAYLKRTKKFRNFGQDQVKFSLFLSCMKPHKPLTSQTISKWLVKLIKLADDDPSMKVKGHSTRAIESSWALFNGASLNNIRNTADWSCKSTFIKFYLRDVNALVLDC